MSFLSRLGMLPKWVGEQPSQRGGRAIGDEIGPTSQFFDKSIPLVFGERWIALAPQSAADDEISSVGVEVLASIFVFSPHGKRTFIRLSGLGCEVAACQIGHDGDDERNDFSDFSLWATKCQASIQPVRRVLIHRQNGRKYGAAVELDPTIYYAIQLLREEAHTLVWQRVKFLTAVMEAANNQLLAENQLESV
ncbi:hypothetical protein [Pararhizobium sp. DWP3-4]|uniref:hypothetical protein n=1 Tax=unclassified Pararhizobium TaxID=2643050 RepID=UPI003CFA1567